MPHYHLQKYFISNPAMILKNGAEHSFKTKFLHYDLNAGSSTRSVLFKMPRMH
uniref:Uncharacterized protein n=1 Tax=Arundo donax TaxID=35708 RepID=A0A0A9H4R0_ARUDO